MSRVSKFRLHWKYDMGYVDINMPSYISNALMKYQHTPPNVNNMRQFNRPDRSISRNVNMLKMSQYPQYWIKRQQELFNQNAARSYIMDVQLILQFLLH